MKTTTEFYGEYENDADVKVPAGVEDIQLWAAAASGGKGGGNGGGGGGAGTELYSKTYPDVTFPVRPGGTIKIVLGKHGADGKAGGAGGAGGAGATRGGNGGKGDGPNGGGGGGGGGSTSFTHTDANGTLIWSFEISGGGGGGGAGLSMNDEVRSGGHGGGGGPTISNGDAGSSNSANTGSCGDGNTQRDGKTAPQGMAGNHGSSGGGGGGAGAGNFGCGGRVATGSSGGGGSTGPIATSDVMFDNGFTYSGGRGGDGWAWIAAAPTSVIDVDASTTNLCFGNKQIVGVGLHNPSRFPQEQVTIKGGLTSPKQPEKTASVSNLGGGEQGKRVVVPHDLGVLPIGKHQFRIWEQTHSTNARIPWRYRGGNLSVEINVRGCGAASQTALDVPTEGLRVGKNATVSANIVTADGTPITEGQVTFWQETPSPTTPGETVKSDPTFADVGPTGIATATMEVVARKITFHAEYTGSRNFSSSTDSTERDASARYTAYLNFEPQKTIVADRYFKVRIEAVPEGQGNFGWFGKPHMLTPVLLSIPAAGRNFEIQLEQGYNYTYFDKEIPAKLPVGKHKYTLTVAGDPNFDVRKLEGTLNVIEATNTVEWKTPTDPIEVGTKANAEFHVKWQSGLDPATGTVTAAIAGLSLPNPQLDKNVGKWKVPTDSPGTYTLDATYLHPGETKALAAYSEYEVVKASSKTAISVPKTAAFGDTVPLEATISSTTDVLAGDVEFYVNDALVATEPIEGKVASVEITKLKLGAHKIHAVYKPDDVAYAVTSKSTEHTLTVAPVQTKIVADGDKTLTYGDSLTVDALVDAPGHTAEGTVQFVSGATMLDEVTVADGKATLVIDRPRVGAHEIKGLFVPTVDHLLGSTSEVFKAQVEPRATSLEVGVDPDPLIVKSPGTVTAQVRTDRASLAPTGSVVFTLDGTQIATEFAPTSVDGGIAEFTTDISVDQVGSKQLTAQFVPTEEFSASSETVDVNVLQAPTQIAVSLQGPLFYGQTPVASITVTAPGSAWAAVAGPVDVSVDGAAATRHNLAIDGTVDVPLSGLTPGAHTLAVNYAGAGEIAGSSSSSTFTVEAVRTRATLELPTAPPTLGEDFTVTASVVAEDPFSMLRVTPEPLGGDVEIAVNGAVAGTVTLDCGTAALALDGLPAGEHRISARFLGDANYQASEVEVPQHVAKIDTITSVSTPTGRVTAGESVKLSATLDGLHTEFAPTGTVQFLANGKKLGNPVALERGQASLRVSDLGVGTNAVTARFSGDSNYEPSASTPIEVAVNAKPAPNHANGAANGNADGSADGLASTGAPTAGPLVGLLVLLGLGFAAVGLTRRRPTLRE